MKSTARISEIVESIFNNNCYSEFENDCRNQITFFVNSYITKIVIYDEDTHELLNEKFFKKFKLSSEKADYAFKKIFFNKFYDRELKYQTFDIFLSKIVSILSSYNDVISYYYDNIEKYLNDAQNTINNNANTSTTDVRTLSSTLPQDNINMSIDNDYLQYGDNNTINKTKNIAKGESNDISSKFDYNVMKNIFNNNIIDYILKKIDNECFLQVW